MRGWLGQCTVRARERGHIWVPTFWNGKEAREDAQAKHFGSTHLTGQPTDARVSGGPGVHHQNKSWGAGGCKRSFTGFIDIFAEICGTARQRQR